METNDTAIPALAALANETRLNAFRLLVQAGPDGLPAGKLAETLDTPPQTLSFHLKELAGAGLVNAERQGRSILYRAQFDRMVGLLTFLTEDCCGGQCEISLCK
ncbi:MAG: ArsR/SmtB family transcription factor [Alphaproteobacteria bacterium]